MPELHPWLEALCYSNGCKNVFSHDCPEIPHRPDIPTHAWKVMFKESCKISLGENPNIADEKLALLSNLTRICNIYILYAAALLKFDIINFCAI